MSQRPFRKIKVREHLGPGTHPSIFHSLQASRLVADEITVRLSKRCVEIKSLKQTKTVPFGDTVISWYEQTCKELFEFTDIIEEMRVNPQPTLYQRLKNLIKPETEKSEFNQAEDLALIKFGSECMDERLRPHAQALTNRFFHTLEAAVKRHKPIVMLAAVEFAKIMETHTSKEEEREIQAFLTKFHRQRIAVRLLIGHCVALMKPLPLDNMVQKINKVGIFCTKTPIEDIVIEAVAMAEELCMITYGCVPHVELSCSDSKNDLLYIPSHLQHIIFELTKNAMSAVIEKELKSGSLDSIDVSKLPPIIVHWDNSPEQCNIEIRDQGIGIPKENLENVFLFHYSTAKKPVNEITVMAGYGYGLPLSRLYARFLKGDIWLESELGKGTTVTIRLKGTWDPDELI